GLALRTSASAPRVPDGYAFPAQTIPVEFRRPGTSSAQEVSLPCRFEPASEVGTGCGERPHRGGGPFPAINVVRRGVPTRSVFVQGLRLKNAHLWTPTKFVLTDSGLEASRDPREVSAGSRLMTSILAGVYEAALRRHARGVLVDL